MAIVDTGIDYKHEDLINNIWINKNEIPNNQKDDDGMAILTIIME